MEKDWAGVFRTEQNFQAEISREILENEKIECVVFNEGNSSFPLLGKLEVWFHQDSEAKASKILNDLIL
jgi:hypothetical protein